MTVEANWTIRALQGQTGGGGEKDCIPPAASYAAYVTSQYSGSGRGGGGGGRGLTGIDYTTLKVPDNGMAMHAASATAAAAIQ